MSSTFGNKKLYLNTQILNIQESEVKSNFELNFGLGTNGFCDNCLNTLDLIIQGVHYFKENDKLSEDGNFQSFNQAFRFFSYLHFHRNSYSIKSVYNNISTGYYVDSATQLRTMIETFVRLKFIYNKNSIELIHQAVAGHFGWKGKRFNVSYKKQFEDLAPGSYKQYQILCDFAHGAFIQNIFKWRVSDGIMSLDKGLIYKERETKFNVSFFTICLIGNLKFLKLIFPEIFKNSGQDYKQKYQETFEFWNIWLTEAIAMEHNPWYRIMKPITDI